jgi:hypothetical protein
MVEGSGPSQFCGVFHGIDETSESLAQPASQPDAAAKRRAQKMMRNFFI